LNDITFSEPCVVFALRREALYFRKQFEPEQRVPGAPCWAAFCGPLWLHVVVLETGVGSSAMETALRWLLAKPLFDNVPLRPKLVLSAGFSGALRPQQRVGDLILATEVVDQDGRSWPTTWPGELPPGEWRPPLARGRILTMPALIADPALKKSLGERFDALAVDMESATLAQLCQQQNIPFGCLRVISDGLDTPLSPRLGTLLRRGRVSPFRLGLALLTRPWLAAELWRLGGATRTAARQLNLALGELLTLTLNWMEPDDKPAL
jgi:adenosylhomocysteine nucleosidase